MPAQPLLPTTLLRQARHQLLEFGACPPDLLGARLAQSWQRSLSAGLPPIGQVSPAGRLPERGLQQLRAHNHGLIRHSVPVMEYLFTQVRHSHSMVILADSQGVLMHTLGDLDFLSQAERVALACGASWHESQRGTNAIGTALAEVDGVEVHGAEHYLECHSFLTCAAAPIVSASGELLGVLDISGHQGQRHPHTLGLVSMAARMIENSLLLSGYQQQTVLQLHPQPEGLGGIAQGLLALSDSSGCLLGANRTALQWLGLPASALGGRPWQECFATPWAQVHRHGRQHSAEPLRLQTSHGQWLYAQVQWPRHVPAVLPTGKVAHSGTDTAATATPEIDAFTRLDTGDLRWRSAADKARRVAAKSIPLLVLGESGVGKELFAQAAHAASPRRAGPFVAINCAALPEHLIEAELFGYAPGAFTGARKQGSPGRLRQAHGGTLFLDEIGDMPLPLQARLLRVLQERQVTPLGCGEPTAVDFWLICATHQALRDAVEQGRFRNDLYYRINGLSVQLPALRERSDFQALTHSLLAELDGPPDVYLDPCLLQALSRYHWPGNLRQYSNMLRTAIALLEPGERCISWAHLPDDLWPQMQAPAVCTPPNTPVDTPITSSSATSWQTLSRQALAQALEQHQGNISAAARQLGISRQTVYRRLRAV